MRFILFGNESIYVVSSLKSEFSNKMFVQVVDNPVQPHGQLWLSLE